MSDPAPVAAKRRGPGFWVGRVAAVIAAIVLALILWDGIHAFVAYDALINAEGDVRSLESAVTSNQLDAFPVIYADMKSNTATAAGATSDPIWRATEHVPVLGGNLAAVREVAQTVNTLVTTGIAPLADKAKGLDLGDFRPKNGQIDMQRIESFIPAINAADKGLLAAQKSGNAIDTSHDLGPVGTAIEGFRVVLEQGILDVAKVKKVVAQVPPALGSTGPRDYLFVLSDDSSDRANGGAASSIALVKIDNGAISIVRTESASALGGTVSDATTKLDELPPFAKSTPATSILDLQRSPEFPATAKVIAAAWNAKYHDQVDAVVATDSVGFSYLTSATGKTVTAATAPADTTVLQSTLASTIAGAGNTASYLTAASHLFREHRLVIWTAQKGLQTAIATTSLAGALPKDNTGVTTYGLFLNQPAGATADNSRDITASAKLQPALCTASTQKSSQLTVTLTSTSATTEDVLVYGPTKFAQGKFSITGGKVIAHTTATIGKRPVEEFTVSLPAGHAVALVVTHVVGGPTPAKTVEIRTTPRWQPTTLGYAACS